MLIIEFALYLHCILLQGTQVQLRIHRIVHASSRASLRQQEVILVYARGSWREAEGPRVDQKCSDPSTPAWYFANSFGRVLILDSACFLAFSRYA